MEYWGDPDVDTKLWGSHSKEAPLAHVKLLQEKVARTPNTHTHTHKTYDH